MLMNKEKAVRELENLLSKVENQARILDELETAQWHYMDLVGITLSGLFDKSELKKNGKNILTLLKLVMNYLFLKIMNAQRLCLNNITLL